MLFSMYGRSLADSSGVTWKRCTKAGYATPATTATSAQRPTATTGNVHPRCQMLKMNSPQASSEMRSNR